MKIKDSPRLNELREMDREIRAREKERRAEIKERLQEIRFQGKEQMKRLKNFDYRTLRQRHLKKLTLLHSNDLHGEWFQVSKGFFCEYDRAGRRIQKLSMNGREVEDGGLFRVAVGSYHYLSIEETLGITADEVEKNGPPKRQALLASNVLEEYFANNPFIKLDGERRLLIHEP